MATFELHNLVETKYKQLEELVVNQAETFVYNPMIATLQNEIFELQTHCTHKWNEDGVCEICFAKKEEENE